MQLQQLELQYAPVMNNRTDNGFTSYSETWSMNPGATLRQKRGISGKEQQVRAKHPVVLAQDIFQAESLRKKAYYADSSSLVFCGEVHEVLRWLQDAGILADCVVTSPPFYGQRDYAVVGQLGLEQTPQEFIKKLVEAFAATREVLQTTGSLWVN